MAIRIEQIGSAIINPKFCIMMAEAITPILPSVSARMCKNTPCKICLLGPAVALKDGPSWECRCPWPWAWSWSWLCAAPCLASWLWQWSSWPWLWSRAPLKREWLWPWPEPWECPWPPWLKTNIPTRFTTNPRIETSSSLSWCTSGGANALSTPSEKIKKAVKIKNSPLTKPARTSALTYP